MRKRKKDEDLPLFLEVGQTQKLINTNHIKGVTLIHYLAYPYPVVVLGRELAQQKVPPGFPWKTIYQVTVYSDKRELLQVHSYSKEQADALYLKVRGYAIANVKGEKHNGGL